MGHSVGAAAIKENTMYRVLCVLALILAFAGSSGAQDAECPPDSEGTPCDDALFCNGTDLCGVKEIDGRPTFGCLFHGGDPCS